MKKRRKLNQANLKNLENAYGDNELVSKKMFAHTANTPLKVKNLSVLSESDTTRPSSSLSGLTRSQYSSDVKMRGTADSFSRHMKQNIKIQPFAKSVKPRVVGLDNQGNFCYFNAVV